MSYLLEEEWAEDSGAREDVRDLKIHPIYKVFNYPTKSSQETPILWWVSESFWAQPSSAQFNPARPLPLQTVWFIYFPHLLMNLFVIVVGDTFQVSAPLN